MNVPTIACPMCGNPMPANVQYCPTCGHTNAFVAPGSAIAPSSPRPAPPESGFVTPMPPPAFGADAGANAKDAMPTGGSSAETPPSNLEASSDTPQGGSPTANIGSAVEGAHYTPSPPSPAWQPGQYASNPAQGGQAPNQPPAYSPDPMQQGQVLPQYGQAQGLTQYGAQPYAQPPAPVYGQPPPINYQYQQQIGVAGVPTRNPTVALLLELLGYVGFLGIGHLYAGRTARGIAMLIGWWVYLIVSSILVIVLIGFCLLLVGLVVPILSGLWIKRDLERDNAMFQAQY